MLQDDTGAAQQQDVLRPLRQFIGTLNAAFNDQSYAGADGYAANPPRQFSVVGPRGSSVEGQPIQLTGNGGLTISPAIVLIGLGLVIVYALHKG